MLGRWREITNINSEQNVDNVIFGSYDNISWSSEDSAGGDR